MPASSSHHMATQSIGRVGTDSLDDDSDACQSKFGVAIPTPSCFRGTISLYSKRSTLVPMAEIRLYQYNQPRTRDQAEEGDPTTCHSCCQAESGIIKSAQLDDIQAPAGWNPSHSHALILSRILSSTSSSTSFTALSSTTFTSTHLCIWAQLPLNDIVPSISLASAPTFWVQSSGIETSAIQLPSSSQSKFDDVSLGNHLFRSWLAKLFQHQRVGLAHFGCEHESSNASASTSHRLPHDMIAVVFPLNWTTACLKMIRLADLQSSSTLSADEFKSQFEDAFHQHISQSHEEFELPPQSSHSLVPSPVDPTIAAISSHEKSSISKAKKPARRGSSRATANADEVSNEIPSTIAESLPIAASVTVPSASYADFDKTEVIQSFPNEAGLLGWTNTGSDEGNKLEPHEQVAMCENPYSDHYISLLFPPTAYGASNSHSSSASHCVAASSSSQPVSTSTFSLDQLLDTITSDYDTFIRPSTGSSIGGVSNSNPSPQLAIEIIRRWNEKAQLAWCAAKRDEWLLQHDTDDTAQSGIPLSNDLHRLHLASDSAHSIWLGRHVATRLLHANLKRGIPDNSKSDERIRFLTFQLHIRLYFLLPSFTNPSDAPSTDCTPVPLTSSTVEDVTRDIGQLIKLLPKKENRVEFIHTVLLVSEYDLSRSQHRAANGWPYRTTVGVLSQQLSEYDCSDKDNRALQMLPKAAQPATLEPPKSAALPIDVDPPPSDSAPIIPLPKSSRASSDPALINPLSLSLPALSISSTFSQRVIGPVPQAASLQTRLTSSRTCVSMANVSRRLEVSTIVRVEKRKPLTTKKSVNESNASSSTSAVAKKRSTPRKSPRKSTTTPLKSPSRKLRTPTKSPRSVRVTRSGGGGGSGSAKKSVTMRHVLTPRRSTPKSFLSPVRTPRTNRTPCGSASKQHELIIAETPSKPSPPHPPQSARLTRSALQALSGSASPEYGTSLGRSVLSCLSPSSSSSNGPFTSPPSGVAARRSSKRSATESDQLSDSPSQAKKPRTNRALFASPVSKKETKPNDCVESDVNVADNGSTGAFTLILTGPTSSSTLQSPTTVISLNLHSATSSHDSPAHPPSPSSPSTSPIDQLQPASSLPKESAPSTSPSCIVASLYAEKTSTTLTSRRRLLKCLNFDSVARHSAQVPSKEPATLRLSSTAMSGHISVPTDDEPPQKRARTVIKMRKEETSAAISIAEEEDTMEMDEEVLPTTSPSPHGRRLGNDNAVSRVIPSSDADDVFSFPASPVEEARPANKKRIKRLPSTSTKSRHAHSSPVASTPSSSVSSSPSSISSSSWATLSSPPPITTVYSSPSSSSPSTSFSNFGPRSSRGVSAPISSLSKFEFSNSNDFSPKQPQIPISSLGALGWTNASTVGNKRYY